MSDQKKSFWELTIATEKLRILTFLEMKKLREAGIVNICGHLYGDWATDDKYRRLFSVLKKGGAAAFADKKSGLIDVLTDPEKRRIAYIILDKEITRNAETREIEKNGTKVNLSQKPRGIFQMQCPTCGEESFSPAPGSELQTYKCDICSEGTTRKTRLTEEEKLQNKILLEERNVIKYNDEMLALGRLGQHHAAQRAQSSMSNSTKRKLKYEQQLSQMRGE